MNLATQLRHFLTFLASIGTMFLTWNLIAPDQVDAVNQAGSDLIGPLVVILGAVAAGVTRWLLSWVANVFRTGAADESDSEAGGSGGRLPLALFLGTMAALMAGLPSCSTLAEYPLTGTIYLRDPGTGAKGGLVFSPGKDVAGMLKVPLVDSETGEVLGMVDLKSGK